MRTYVVDCFNSLVNNCKELNNIGIDEKNKKLFKIRNLEPLEIGSRKSPASVSIGTEFGDISLCNSINGLRWSFIEDNFPSSYLGLNNRPVSVEDIEAVFNVKFSINVEFLEKQ